MSEDGDSGQSAAEAAAESGFVSGGHETSKGSFNDSDNSGLTKRDDSGDE